MEWGRNFSKIFGVYMMQFWPFTYLKVGVRGNFFCQSLLENLILWFPLKNTQYLSFYKTFGEKSKNLRCLTPKKAKIQKKNIQFLLEFCVDFKNNSDFAEISCLKITKVGFYWHRLLKSYYLVKFVNMIIEQLKYLFETFFLLKIRFNMIHF